MPSASGAGGPRVGALFYKPDAQAAWIAVSALELLRGQGIAGDVHARRMSPRQLLITRREDLDAFGLRAGQLFENIVLDGTAAADFVPGARLRLGTAALRLTMHCEPCGRIAAVVSPRAILGRRGLLGVVTAGGRVALGTEAQLEPGVYAPLPEGVYPRFLALLAQVPAGQVIDYRSLLLALGVTRGYLRAIPAYLQRARREGGWPLHRLVDSRGGLIPRLGPEQAQLLAAEGVPLGEGGRVELETYAWTDGEQGWILGEPADA